jgi:hypothetical protein
MQAIQIAQRDRIRHVLEHKASNPLRLTQDPGGEEQYSVFDDAFYVGRIYQAGADRWFWSLGYDVTSPRNPPYGHEPTRDAAMEKIETALLSFARDRSAKQLRRPSASAAAVSDIEGDPDPRA